MDVDHSLWDKIIPRVIAIGTFAYLVYALAWRGEEMSYLHVVVFLLTVALVLVPFARRLKIPNILDFEAKLNETRKELGDIRNRISTTFESHITPVQHQWTVIGMGEPLVKQLAQSITEEFRRTPLFETGKDDKYTRNQFLRKADSYRLRVYTTLFLTRPIQIALHEKRPFKEEGKSEDFGTGNTDEKINYMIKHMLNGGVELFVPPNEVAETSEGLKAVKDLLEIRKKVDNKEIALPDQQKTEELFDKIANAVNGIIAGAVLIEWQAILYQIEMMQKIKELRESLNTNDSPSED